MLGDRKSQRARLLDTARHYHVPASSDVWTAGLIGGIVGAFLVGACWYMQTKNRAGQRISRQLGLSSQGQSPNRSHIQISSHPARQ
jgi:hypothetical protein